MPSKKYYIGVDRKDFNCLDCGRLVSVQEQREQNYHQVLRCRECQIIYRRGVVRDAVKKHYEKNQK